MLSAAPVAGFEDGFGARRLDAEAPRGDRFERLIVAPSLAEAGGFVGALEEGLARLGETRHAAYAAIRRVERAEPSGVALVSEHVDGWRLSEMLALAHARGWPVDIGAALGLLRQLVPAMALPTAHDPQLALGTVACERIIVTPGGRLVLAEYVLAQATESLRYGRARLWRELRVAAAPPPETRLGPRADVTALGVVALSLVLGRLLADEEFPDALPRLIAGARESSGGTSHPIGAALADWLARALQIDPRTAFRNPREAQLAFDEVLASDRAYIARPKLLELFVARHAQASTSVPAATAVSAPEVEPPFARQAAGSAAVRASYPPEAPATAPAARVEHAPASVSVPASVPPPGAVAAERGRPMWTALVTVLASVEAVALLWVWLTPSPTLAGDGELVVHSRPAAARVAVNGEERGLTPLTLRLAPGTHVLEVRVGRAEPRIIPLQIRAGVQTAQYVELTSVPTTGGLDVRSQPPGARVLLNGQPRGRTPLALRELPPGAHDIVVEAGARRVRQTVRVEPGVTGQLVVPLSPQ